MSKNYLQIALKDFNAGRYPRALEQAQKSIAKEPTAGAYHLAAAAARELGLKNEEFKFAKEAASLDPNPKFVKAFAISILDHELWNDAMGLFMSVVAMNGDLESQVNAAWCSYRLGHITEAELFLKTIASFNPDDVLSRSRLGSMYHQTGQFEEAEAVYREAIALVDKGYSPALYYHMAMNKKFSDGDPDITAMEELLPRIEDNNDEDRRGQSYVNYALGKAYGDTGQTGRAMSSYLAGGRIRGLVDKYDHEAHVEQIDKIIATFPCDHAEGCEDDTPVFIVGMPRSGTTLLENILASHPEIFGAGELKYVYDIAIGGHSYPECFDPSRAQEIGEEYVNKIKKISSARHVVDKLPHHFLYAGLISYAMPHAKIIHMRRDPVATCFSNFITNFSSPLSYSNDLKTLGQYYKQYLRVMAHWRTFVPMLEISYEELVAKPEENIRAVLDYIGVDFNEECLRHQDHVTEVKTASASQVRNPIYTGSVEKWKKYEEFLGPLLEELGR